MGTNCCNSLSNGYSILQWNILCTKISNEFYFPKTEKKYLSWDYRKMLLKDILEIEKPDIMTLQEIDNYNDFKKDILDNLKIKYDGDFHLKSDGEMGIYIGINPEKFMIINKSKENLPGNDEDDENNLSNYIFVIYEIKEIKSDNTFYLITTHLKSKIHNENIRLIQIQGILSYLNEKGIFRKNFIITGDFNAEPTYQSINNLENYGIESVFDLKNPNDYTMFMYRDEKQKRYIDYIFYKGDILFGKQEKAIVDIDETCGLPNYEFPSDHLFLKAKFKFK